MKSLRTIALAGAACCACVGLKIVIQKRLSHGLEKSLSLMPLQAAYQGRSLKRYSLGFDNLIADLVWIQLIQEASHEKLAANHVSWEYAQLDAITTLDPHFEAAFPFGAAYLSVFRRDKLGAKLLLQKWTKSRPLYWRSNYLYAYHLYFEMQDYPTAAKYMFRAASLPGAPDWLASLGVRLLNETNSVAQALRLSIELFPALEDTRGAKQLFDRIFRLRYRLEEIQWEKALAAYRHETRHDPEELADLVPYRNSRTRELASILNMPNVPEALEPIMNFKFPFRYDRKSRKVIPSIHIKDLETTGIYKKKE